MAKKQTIGEIVRGALRELSKSLLDLMTFKDFRLTDDEVVNKPTRTRTTKGRYKPDIKETKEWNEAWVGGKAPKRVKTIGYKKKKNKKKDTLS